MEIRVLSWNIRHSLGIDGRRDLHRVLAVIQEAGPDIVMLNEVDKRLPRSGLVDQAKWLASGLGMQHCFKPSLGFRLSGFGNALFAQGAIAEHESVQLSFESEPRKALVATVEVRGVKITCVGVHLSPLASLRTVEFARLSHLLSGKKYRTVLAGDFNVGPSSNEISALSSSFIDVFAGHPEPTFPANNPSERIDYLFISSDCNIIDKEVINTEGSDHLPLFAVIDM